VNDDYRDWYRFLGGGYLIGLDLFIEPFVLLSGTDIREQEMQGSHRCAGLIARYVLGKREFQNIVLETLVRWQQNTYDESSQRAPLGQSRSGASSTPAGSPLNVFDVLLQEREALTLAEIAELVKRSPATLAPDVRALVRWGIARKDGSGENAQYAVVPLSPLQVTDIRQTLAGLPRARPTKAEIEKISPTIGQILGRTANTPYIFEQLTVASSGKTKASRQIAFGTLVSEATAHPEVFETLLTIFKDTRYYRIVSTYRTTVASVILSLLRDIETSSGNLPLAANMLYYFCAKWVFSGYFSAGTLDSEFARDRHKIAEKLIEQLDLGHLSEGMRIMQANLDAEAVLQHELRHILRGMLFAIDSAHGPELVKYDSTIHELINAIFVEFSIFSNRLEDEASRTGCAQFSAEIPALVLRNRRAVVSALQQLLNNFSTEFLSTETQLSASEQEAVVKIRRLLSLADKKLRSYLRDPEDAYGEPQNIDIIQIAQEAMEYYSNNKKTSFRLQAPEEPVFVRMDELLALEAFFNLIRNAIDEIGRAEGEITVSIIRDEHWVRVEVIDTGGGIPQGLEEKIFERGFSTKGEGRGIGLYLCRRYVEAAGGQITGANRSDGIKGAVFTVTLPLHEPSSVDPGSSKPKGIAPEHGTSPAKAPDLGGIDFRELPMVTQPMKVPAVNLPAPLMNQIDNLNLDAEWTQIRRMLDAGIIPSTERIKEYLQARYQKGITSREIELVLSGIACILRLEEKYIYATDPALKELLVHLESGLPG
jgi:signal transduction histidine kinase